MGGFMKNSSRWAIWILLTVVVGTQGFAQVKNPEPRSASVSTAEANKNPSDLSQDELFRTIQALDAELFDAYNRCELEKFGSFFPEQLEFCHDQGGLVATTREQLLVAVKQNICGKVHRELVKGTLEVYPMKGYGAVELGTHRFSHPGIDTDEGDAKFVHLWKYENGKWLVPRVISYDHNDHAGKQ
jgi:hypothetical protein